MTTKVAIYARYSTDKQDKSSATGQIKNCKAKAKELGYEVVRTFKDEAMSGTDPNRPGFIALQEGLEVGEFDGVIVDETSRLARTSWTLNKMIEELAFRDQFIIDCKGFDSRNEAGELLASIHAAIDSMELKKIKARTYRGLRERFDKGCSAGGISYGFKKPEPGEKREWYEKQVEPEQAKIVVEIFEMYAAGISPKGIAAELNRRGVPSPGANWKRKGGKTSDGKWRASAINGDPKRGTGILCNPLYKGEYIWNRTEWKKVPGSNKRKYVIRPKSDWKRKQIPKLQIIVDSLWAKVQARRHQVTENSKAIRKALGNCAGPGRGPKYLLSGLLKCDECDSNFIIADSRRYKCSTHTNGGKHACENHLAVNRKLAEELLLTSVTKEVLTDEFLAECRKQVTRLVKEKKAERAKADPRKKYQQRLAQLGKQEANAVNAIVQTGINDALQKRLSEITAEKEELEGQLAATPAKLDTLPDLIPRELKRIRDKILNLDILLDGEKVTRVRVAKARTALRNLFSEMRLVPNYDKGYLEAHMAINKKALALVLTGSSASMVNVVAGAGFEPATFGL